MAKLQASDRAKVEAMLTDATVRIISDTFKHLSPTGCRQAYNDRLDATSYPHEAAGVEEDKSPKATSNSGVVENEPVAPHRALALFPLSRLPSRGDVERRWQTVISNGFFSWFKGLCGVSSTLPLKGCACC